MITQYAQIRLLSLHNATNPLRSTWARAAAHVVGNHMSGYGTLVSGLLHSGSDSLFQNLTPTVSMGRLCNTFGPHENCSRKNKSEDKITRRLEKSIHNSKFSKLFPVVTRLAGLARPVATEKIAQCPYNHDTSTPRI